MKKFLIVLGVAGTAFSAIGGVLFLHEKVSAFGWFSIVITFIGSVIVAMGDAQGGNLAGDLPALSGAVCSAVYTLIGKRCVYNQSILREETGL